MCTFKYGKVFVILFLTASLFSSVVLAQTEAPLIETEICSKITGGAFEHCRLTTTTVVTRDGPNTKTVVDIDEKTWLSETKEGIQQDYPVFTNSDFLRAEKMEGEEGVIRPYKEVITSLWGKKLVNSYELTYVEGDFIVAELDPVVESENGPPLIIILLFISVIVTSLNFAESFFRVTACIIIMMMFGGGFPLVATISVFFMVVVFSSFNKELEKEGGMVIITGLVFAAVTYWTVTANMTPETYLWAVSLGGIFIALEYFVSYKTRSVEEEKRKKEAKLAKEREKKRIAARRFWPLHNFKLWLES